MPIICPAILAANKDEYQRQIEKVVHLAHRIQIDLTDSVFAPHKTVEPDDAWWPAGFLADIHLMFKNPLPAIQKVLPHKPNLIIIHAESEGDFNQVVTMCRASSVKLGVALLAQTPPSAIYTELENIDHVLIFSGDLGSFGGQADLSLLDKVRQLKNKKPQLEIGWDGGINEQNVSELVFGGVDVLDVGSFIQNAEDPARAYHILERIAEETGTT